LGIIELENKQINNRKCDTYSCGVLTAVGFEWGEDVCYILWAGSANLLIVSWCYELAPLLPPTFEGELSKAQVSKPQGGLRGTTMGE